MNYNILILISKTKLMAIEVKDAEHADRISIDGNDIAEIDDENSIKSFISEIKKNYNIEKFSDIDMDVVIVTFHAENKDVELLYNELNGVSTKYIIDIKMYLPIVLLKESNIKKDNIYAVQCFDNEYFMSINSDLSIEYVESAEGKKLVIEPEKLSLIFFFNCEKLVSNEEELQAWKETFAGQIEDKNKDIYELKKENEKLKGQINQLQQVIDKEKEKRKKESLSAKRCILWFLEDCIKDVVGEVHGLLKVVLFQDYTTEYKIKLLKKDGDLVSKDMEVAQIVKRKKYETGEEKIVGNCKVKASDDGRIFYLKENNSYVESDVEIAILADASDTKVDVMEWYKKMK